MQSRSTLFHTTVGVLALMLAVLPGTRAQGPERITIQANAMGTSTQL